MRIVLDVFSGRVNPEWAATAEDAGRIAAMIDALPASAEAPRAVPILGYRGFVVHDRSHGLDVRVHGCSVSSESATDASDASDTPVRHDAERTLERTLAQMALDRIPDEFHRILTAIAAGDI